MRLEWDVGVQEIEQSGQLRPGEGAGGKARNEQNAGSAAGGGSDSGGFAPRDVRSLFGRRTIHAALEVEDVAIEVDFEFPRIFHNHHVEDNGELHVHHDALIRLANRDIPLF